MVSEMVVPKTETESGQVAQWETRPGATYRAIREVVGSIHDQFYGLEMTELE